MEKLENILSIANDLIKDRFNLNISETSLKFYNIEEWKKFCSINKFDEKSHGLYVPESQSAYVLSESSHLISNIFHEYFGHGLFCENSVIGKELVLKSKTDNNINSFLYNLKKPDEYFGICKQNIQDFEGFALWFEKYLCRETDNFLEWEKKKNTLSEKYISLSEYFDCMEDKFTTLGLMYQMGFSKYYITGEIIDILKNAFSYDFSKIEMLILYGSRKPNSDIDLFMVSENDSRNYFNGWLDIYELNIDEFKHLIKNLDISVTDPLFTGELIYGDRNSFFQLRQELISSLITQSSISHNLKRYEELRSSYNSFPDGSREKNNCEFYIYSYLMNAKGLKSGMKYLTLDWVNSY